MTTRCKKNAYTCHATKNGKRCMKPNPWLVFLSGNKKRFKSITQASESYRKVFKPKLLQALIDIAAKDSSVGTKKKDFQRLLCKHMFTRTNTGVITNWKSKANLSRDVATVLNKNSIPRTLEIIGAKQAAKAVVRKQAAVKKAGITVAQKKKVAEMIKRREDRLKKEALEALRKNREKKASAKAALKKAEKAKADADTSAKRQREADRIKRWYQALKKAEKKEKTVNSKVEKAVEKTKDAKEDVAEAKKAKAKVVKAKIPRALARLM